MGVVNGTGDCNGKSQDLVFGGVFHLMIYIELFFPFVSPVRRTQACYHDLLVTVTLSVASCRDFLGVIPSELANVSHKSSIYANKSGKTDAFKCKLSYHIR